MYIQHAWETAKICIQRKQTHGVGYGYGQWCIAKNGGGYTQRGVAKGLKVPCLFMITEVSIAVKKTPRLVYAVYPRIPPQYTTGYGGCQGSVGMGILWDSHWFFCGQGMGVGVEMQFPRQPYNQTASPYSTNIKLALRHLFTVLNSGLHFSRRHP